MDREVAVHLQRMSPMKIRNTLTLAVTEPIQIEEGLLSLTLPLLAWLAASSVAVEGVVELRLGDIRVVDVRKPEITISGGAVMTVNVLPALENAVV